MANYIHKKRGNGDTILSEEWNNMGLKVQEINAKFDEEKSVINSSLQITESLNVSDYVNLQKDIQFGDKTKGFIIHSRDKLKDFLQITSKKADGNWDWNKGLTIRNTGRIGVGTVNPGSVLAVYGTTKDGWDSGIELSRDDGGQGKIVVDKDGMKLRTPKVNNHFYFRNNLNKTSLFVGGSGSVGIGTDSPKATFDVRGNAVINGELKVTAKIEAGNSDLYFTKTDHKHTGSGNAMGHAAIENDGVTHNTLMILGRNISGKGRQVKVWDDLGVSRNLSVGANLFVGANTELAGKLNIVSWTKIGTGADSIQFETQRTFHRVAFNHLRFYDWNTNGDMVTFNNRNVGIGTTSPTERLEVNGNIRLNSGTTTVKLKSMVNNGFYIECYNSHHNRNKTRTAIWNGDSNWDFTSDRRLKGDIENEGDILSRLMKLDVKNYRWKDDMSKETKSIGFIAQDVKPLFPVLVNQMDNPEFGEPTYTLGYTTFGVLAVGGLKELKLEKDAEIKQLHLEIKKIKAQIDELSKTKNEYS